MAIGAYSILTILEGVRALDLHPVDTRHQRVQLRNSVPELDRLHCRWDAALILHMPPYSISSSFEIFATSNTLAKNAPPGSSLHFSLHYRIA